ncbi:MAG: hypothetical protein JNK11_00155 [Alphaproteobacteria bacterium]|nr:hypothetical protein [Alphaproteobacteria bacterium]
MPTHRVPHSSDARGVTPQQVLARSGPRLQLEIRALRRDWAGSPVTVWALIDTGAAESCIDEALAGTLGLKLIDWSGMTGIGGPAEHPVYMAELRAPALAWSLKDRLYGVRIDGEPPVILGRDFLASCVLIYDGPGGSITICA